MIGVGSIINNRFRLDRLLGRGGFAQVFLCTDGVLGRQVAIKVLDPAQSGAENFDFLGRFQAEARAVAALEHPNILGVYDYGEVEGTVYLVMPFIDGGSLHDRIAGGRILPLREIAEYVRQTAGGLDYAHRRGIVHRDIKPQNLLLRNEDNRLLIADFGVAKVLQEGSAHTQTAAIGTVAYMAPEQLSGRAAPSIDIYALGCVLFQLLTGHVPYGGPVTQAMYGHMNAPIPSVRDHSEGRLPATFQPLIDRALAKRPEDRFASAGDLARSFDALLASTTAPLPPQATVTTPVTPGQTWTGGHGGANSTPPLSAPPLSYPQQPTVVGPTGPPVYTPTPPPPPPAASSRRVWLLPAGIGAVAVVGVLLAVLYINLIGNDRNANATPTASPRAAAATATTGTSGFATATATIPVVITPPASPSAAASASAQPTQSPTAGVPSAQPSVAPPSAAPATAIATATRAPSATPTVAPATIERGPVLSGHTDHVRAVAWLGERQRLLSGGGEGAVKLWLNDGTLLNTFTGRTFAVTSIAVSPDRSMVAVGSDDFQIHVWRADGTELRVLSGHTYYVASVAWSPDSKQIVSGSYDGTVRIWSADGSGSRILSGHSDVVLGVSWSSTGLIASASWDKTIRLWNADGTFVKALEGHTDQVFTVAWSPDGQTLASGGRDNTVRLWRADGTPVAALSGHGGAVSSVAWSPDGAMFASGSFDKTARLWTATGQPLGTITDHTDAVTSVAWGPENGQLATGSWDRTVRLWRVRR